MTTHPAPGPTASIVWRWTSGTPDALRQARVAVRSALGQFGYDDEVIGDTEMAVGAG